MQVNLSNFLAVACCAIMSSVACAQSGVPNPPPPAPPDSNWQNLLGADPAFATAATKMIATEQAVAAALPLPPASGRPAAAPDWEATGSACAAFVNVYKLSGSPQYLTYAKQIADNFVAWNDWLVANRSAAIPYLGWGPAIREAEFGCPAIPDYYADDLWDTSGALRCLLKFSETDPNPTGTTYFAHAKKVIDGWTYVDHASGDPSAPALANNGPYAAYGLRWYRKSSDPCDVRYVKNTNIAMSEQLFRMYGITQDPNYLDAATRTLYAELWDILTQSNFGYNSYMIYDDISKPIYAQMMVPENEREVTHVNGQVLCRDDMGPPADSSCFDHLGFEGFETSQIEQLINVIDAGKFPVASTVYDVGAATQAIMSQYHASAIGNAAQFNWADWLAAGVESPTYVTAYNCAQRFSSDPTFYAQCLTAFGNNPTYSMDSRGDVLYSLTPDAIFTPNLAQGAVVSAASGTGSAVAPGGLVTIYGSGIGPSPAAGLELDPTGKISTSVAGTQVLFDGIAAPVIYASQFQTSVVVPFEIANQSMTEMQVRNNGALWKRYTVMVAPSAPALFTANSSGKGQGAFLNQDSSGNSSSNPAAKGSVVVLYATGAGQSDPAGVDGLLSNVTLPKPLLSVSVTIGGQPAAIQYAGAAPGAVAGVIQVNCVVPPSVASGNPEVVLTVGDAHSPSGVTVAVK
jgi:uncharacterized protein (TIGR03437 family)